MAKNDFTGELLHFGSVRFRINGSGNLLSTLYSLDEVRSSSLPDLTMATLTNREPVILANFIEQRAQLDIRTEEIDEYFIISKIVIFIRPTATGYAQ